MARVFISYRRDDSAEVTGRIFDRLRAHFDKQILFLDVDVIPYGSDIRQVIREAVEDCQVLLAMIGPTWLNIASRTGTTQRLDDPHDFVRLEIETALKRHIPVIPILVGKATMPEATHLPDSLQPLVFRQSLEVRRDPDFHRDVDTLIRGLTGLLTPPLLGDRPVDITLFPRRLEPVPSLKKRGEVIEVGSKDWLDLTERRAELIHKKNRQGLTEPELAEYEQLQRLSREVINRTFPRPKLSPDELAAIKQALDSVGE